jgi:hypothetical protein
MPRRGKRAERAKAFTDEQKLAKALLVLHDVAFPQPDPGSNDPLERNGHCFECGSHPDSRKMAGRLLYELGVITKERLEEVLP